MPMETVAGLVLTGGSSRRLGRDKAMLPTPEGPLAVRVSSVVAAAANGPVVEVGPGVTGLAHVVEDPPGAGPLAALAAGAGELRRRGHDGAFLVMACDLPNLTVGLAAWLRDQAGTCVPVVDGRLQPLCARYELAAGEVADRLLAAGERSLRALLDALDVVYLDEAAWSCCAVASTFSDIDTLADLAASGLVQP